MRRYIKTELVRIIAVEHRLSYEISCHSDIPGVLLPAATVILVHASCCGIENNVDESEVAVLCDIISKY